MKIYVNFYLGTVMFSGVIEDFDSSRRSHTVHETGFGPVVVKTVDLIHLNPHLKEV